MQIVRIIEIAGAVVFLGAAVLKAFDMAAFAQQIKYYGVLTDPQLIRLSAYASLAAESIIGALLLAGIRLRGITYGLTAALLLGFTGLVAWAWFFHGLEDCGCFGKYVEMGPAETIAKNVVTLIAIGAAWSLAVRRGFPGTCWARPVSYGLALLSILGVGAVAGFSGNSLSPAPSPGEAVFGEFEAEGLALGDGEYLVAMLSASCDHCAAAVPLLNEAHALLFSVQVTGLMLGDSESVDRFRDFNGPEFPIASIDAIAFFELIGREPPRFYYVRDGVPVRHLDSLDPSLEDLLALVDGDSDPQPAAEH